MESMPSIVSALLSFLWLAASLAIGFFPRWFWTRSPQFLWRASPSPNGSAALARASVAACWLYKSIPTQTPPPPPSRRGWFVAVIAISFAGRHAARSPWSTELRLGVVKARLSMSGSTVGSCRRLLLGSTVGSCWDRPSALAGIDRRLLLGSTATCKVSSANGNCTRRFGAAERHIFSVFLIAI
jgi:hypothetical protein